MPDHDCLEYLDYQEMQCSQNVDVEVDGAIERWTERWWECRLCGEKYTEGEVTRLQNAREVKGGDGTETEIRER